MKFDAKITEIIPRNKDVTSFRFNHPKGLMYKPGQYLLATIMMNGNNLMHPFSFSSSPTDEEFIEFTKKFTDSDYSKALKELTLSDYIQIDAPYGQFTFTGEYPKICMLSGGIGITPFWSICKYCTDKKIESNIVLIYGCRSENDIAFYNELEKSQAKNPHLKVFYVLTQPNNGWGGLTGTINVDLIKKQVGDYNERIFYACGSPNMIESMKKVIENLGLPRTQLKLEEIIGHT